VYSSSYNFWSKTPVGRPLLFNGRTGALIELDGAAEAELVQATLTGKADYLRKDLERLGFIWNDRNTSEVDDVLARRTQPDASTDITISPTYDCNFRCTYCYVEFRDEHMDDDGERRLLKYLEQEIRDSAWTNITWFGGEPLLDWQQVARMSAAIRDFGERHKRAIEQFLTTNAYLLTPRVADALFGSGIRWLHVTIDGCGSGQDTRRVLKDGTGTYQNVLSNLINALQSHPQIGGTLRMNLEPDSLTLTTPLLESIPENLRSRIQVHPTPVILEGVTRDAAFLQEVAAVVSTALDLGFAYYDNDIPVGRRFHCGAEGSRNFQVGPDCSLHKCSPSGKPEVTVGTINENGVPEFNRKADTWLKAPVVGDPCRACEFLCFCQGGCRLDRIRNRHNPRCKDNYLAMPQHVVNRWKAITLGWVQAR
jgi:uncharacterized protein